MTAIRPYPPVRRSGQPSGSRALATTGTQAGVYASVMKTRSPRALAPLTTRSISAQSNRSDWAAATANWRPRGSTRCRGPRTCRASRSTARACSARAIRRRWPRARRQDRRARTRRRQLDDGKGAHPCRISREIAVFRLRTDSSARMPSVSTIAPREKVMDPSRAGTTTKGTRRWLSAFGAVLVVTGLPVTGLAQDPNPRPETPAPVRPVAAETPSSVLASTEDLPRSAQAELGQALTPAQRGASAAHRRYAAAAPVRTRAERTARRNAQARLMRMAQQFIRRGEGGTAYRRQRRMPPDAGYRPRRAGRGWDDGYDCGYRGGWRRGGGGHGRRGWMGGGGGRRGASDLGSGSFVGERFELRRDWQRLRLHVVDVAGKSNAASEARDIDLRHGDIHPDQVGCNSPDSQLRGRCFREVQSGERRFDEGKSLGEEAGAAHYGLTRHLRPRRNEGARCTRTRRWRGSGRRAESRGSQRAGRSRARDCRRSTHAPS